MKKNIKKLFSVSALVLALCVVFAVSAFASNEEIVDVANDASIAPIDGEVPVLLTATAEAPEDAVMVTSAGVAAAPDDGVADDVATNDGNVLLTTTAADDLADDAADEKEGLGVGFWVSMGVLAVLIIVGVVFAIVKWDKLKPWLLSYKSELKKVVWMPWNDVKKGTIVVVVCVIVLAAVIGLLDFVFSKGLIAIHSLIS